MNNDEFVKKYEYRYNFLDVAKAIGVYLVILGHLVVFNWKTFRFIFAFHMPLFFVVAGFVWGGRRELPKFKKFLQKQCCHYLIPFIIVLVLSIFQCIVFPFAGYDLKRLLSMETIRDLYDGQLRFSFFGSSWFLICMFWSQLLFYGMMILKRKCGALIYAFAWMLLAALAVFTPDIFLFLPVYHRLPLKLDSALMSCIFLGIGSLLYKLYGMTCMEEKKWIRYGSGMVLFLVGIPIVYFVSCKNNTYVNLCDAVYARPGRYILGAIAGSLAILGLSILLEKIVILQYIGRNTLVIFLSHGVVYSLLIIFANRIWNMHLEAQQMKLDYICIIISILTLFISLCVAVGVNGIKRIICKKKGVRKS